MSLPAEGRPSVAVDTYAVPRTCEEGSTTALHGILTDRRVSNKRILDLGSGGEEVRNHGCRMRLLGRRTVRHLVVLTRAWCAGCRYVAPLSMRHRSLARPSQARLYWHELRGGGFEGSPMSRPDACGLNETQRDAQRKRTKNVVAS